MLLLLGRSEWKMGPEEGGCSPPFGVALKGTDRQMWIKLLLWPNLVRIKLK